MGLVSRSGVIPIAHTQDTPGPMARTVKDAAHLLTAIAGVDEKDAATAMNLNLADFTTQLNETNLKGIRIGYAGSPFTDRLSKHKLALFDDAIQVLQELGAELVSEIVIPAAEERWGFDILTYEFKPDLNAYLQASDSSNKVRSLAELIEFNQ